MKKVRIDYNPLHIYVLLNNELNIKLIIRSKSFLDSLKKILGIETQIISTYDYICDPNLFLRIKENIKLIELINKNDLSIEFLSDTNSYILLKPFHGIGSIKKGEEYLSLLLLLKQEIMK